jgi:hypothetical protein
MNGYLAGPGRDVINNMLVEEFDGSNSTCDAVDDGFPSTFNVMWAIISFSSLGGAWILMMIVMCLCSRGVKKEKRASSRREYHQVR